MKKIAIVTIIDRNLGNRLQNYALHNYLEMDGFEVHTLVYKKQSKLKEVKRIGKNLLYPFVDKYKDVVWDNFNKKIKWDNRIVNESGDAINNDYDYFVAGSDQIWNPNFDFISDREFLTFASKEKRIAYAASIGVNEIPLEKRDIYDEYFHGFKAISVRENEAAKIVDSFLGLEVPVVIDPTMLIQSDDWAKIADESRLKLKKRYILKYFLGKNSEEVLNAISMMSNENDLEVFDIMNANGKVKREIGPTEFLWLIRNADYICTDSFHGAVFSILFHKQFFVFERPIEKGYGNMNSRIDTLLGKFDLKGRYIHSIYDMENVLKQNISYEHIENLLAIEREKARLYLKNAMKGRMYEQKGILH